MARRGRFGSFLVYLIGSLVVAGAAFTGVRLWQDKDAQLVASREAMAEGLAKGPAVQVATIAQGPKERLITLLGDTRPYQVATLYGKVAGYLKSIAVDRGDHVRSGQVVAEVESAETDRQYDAVGSATSRAQGGCDELDSRTALKYRTGSRIIDHASSMEERLHA